MAYGTCNCGASASFANPVFGSACGAAAVWPQCPYNHGAAGGCVPRAVYNRTERAGGDIDAAIEDLMAARNANTAAEQTGRERAIADAAPVLRTGMRSTMFSRAKVADTAKLDTLTTDQLAALALAVKSLRAERLIA